MVVRFSVDRLRPCCKSTRGGYTSICHLDGVEVLGLVLWICPPIFCGIFGEVPTLVGDRSILAGIEHPVPKDLLVIVYSRESFVIPPINKLRLRTYHIKSSHNDLISSIINCPYYTFFS
jgi:hypothetical protein